MIIDDEPIVRKGLISLIDWSSLECLIISQASNGIEAIDRIYEFLPDIIIADIKMPGLNGLELAEKVYKDFPHSKFIILTGYADFSYAQVALKNGVVDYILKSSALENISDAIKRAKVIIDMERRASLKLMNLSVLLNKNQIIMKSQLINNIINQILVDPTLIEKEMKGLHLCNEPYCVLLVTIRKCLPRNCTKSTIRIKVALSLSFKDYKNFNLLIKSNRICYILSCKSPNKNTLSIISKISQKAVDELKEQKGLQILIGISNFHTNTSEFYSAYSEATKSLEYSFYDESETNIFLYSVYTNNATIKVSVVEASTKIIESIKLNDVSSALSIFKCFHKKQNEIKENPENVKIQYLKLRTSIEQLLLSCNLTISTIMHHPVNIFAKFLENESLHELYIFTEEIITATTIYLCNNKNHNNYIIKLVKKYIANNYYKKISLRSIADSFHINSSYLSRIYSKETTETLTETINKLKIGKAKQLLEKTNMKTNEISLLIGIDDAAYFSHLFKKYTGFSPIQYRSITTVKND